MKKLTRFSDGLTLLYYQMPEVRSVSMGVFVKVGSVYESAANNGISHYIEHTTFKGTEKRSAFDIVAETDNMGAQMNAFTSKIATCYYIQCIDSDAEKSAEILSDLFFNSTYPDAECEKEKGVILEEIAMCNDTPDDLSYEMATAAYYKGHPIARPILGSKSNVKGFTRNDILNYKNKHYTADNTYLAIAGNISYENAVEIANKYFIDNFSIVKCKKRKISVPETHCAYVKKIKNIEQGNINILFPSCTFGDKSRNAVRILNTAFGYGMSSRLYQTIREQMGLAYSVYSYYTSYPFSGMSMIYLGTNPLNAANAIKATKKEIDAVKKSGISNDEFMRGKAQMLSSLVFGSESCSAIMTAIGRNAVKTDDLLNIDELINDIKNITMDDINDAISTAFDINRATVSYVGPKIENNLLDVLQNG